MGRLGWASATLATGLLLVNVSPIWAVAGAPPVPGEAAPPPAAAARAADLSPAESATCALRYLASEQAADGSVGDQAGVTADFIFGAAAAGFDPTTLKKSGSSTVYEFLEAGAGATLSNAATTAKDALAALAGKLDPSAFGGHDLLSAIDATYSSTSHAYGDGQTYTQSLAILALVAAADSGHSLPADAVAELISVQDTDGSWDFQGAKDAAGGGDTNSTAIAIQALVAAGTPVSDGSITKGLAYLAGQQLSDGGFPYSDAYGPPFSDPDSDAIVVQGLVAAGENPAGPTWTKGGHTALSNIVTFQDARGGFVFPGNPGPDTFTTSQVPAGLAGIPFPGRTSWTAGATLPAGLCAAAVAAPTASHGPRATPPATATVGLATRGSPGGFVPVVALAALAGLVVGEQARRGRRSR